MIDSRASTVIPRKTYVHESPNRDQPFFHNHIRNTLIEVDASLTCDENSCLDIGGKGACRLVYFSVFQNHEPLPVTRRFSIVEFSWLEFCS